MLKQIVIAENCLEPETWKSFDVENVLDFLIEYFGKWPENARLYNKNVSEVSDVTPSCEKDFENILQMEGRFYVVVYPGAPITIIAIVVAIIAIAVVVFMPKPQMPSVAIRSGSDSPSSNNELSNRTNKERINARIPDIYGQVRSVPDLISLPFRIFKNNKEVEYSYMCLGVGEYDIEDIKEEATLISDMTGCSVEFYKPNTSPNTIDGPYLTIGEAINMPIRPVKSFSSVNGQTLQPKEELVITGETDIKCTRDYKLFTNNSEIDFTGFFSVGDNIIVSGAMDLGLDLDGEYLISNVTANTITLDQPYLVNSDWSALHAGSSDTAYLAIVLGNNTGIWFGPFICDSTENDQIWLNFVAQNGIYKDNGTTKIAFPITIEARVTPIDSNGDPIDTPAVFSTTLIWNYSTELFVGSTLMCNLIYSGRHKVECRRLTSKVTESGSQVYQEVKWRDMYAVGFVPNTPNGLHFGNVTTVQSMTVNSSELLKLTERKLNMLVTRKIPQRISGSTFSTILHPTKRVDEIISAICLDPKIGNRSVSEIDFDNIYSTVNEIIEYFGTEKAAEFSYTFDSSNFSFEEIIHSVASSVFCLAYRRGNKIKFSFEKENETSTILFNHRNKIPGTETRTISFGNSNDNDGIEYKYIDPEDDSLVSIYIPADKSAVNPNVVESIGVRNFPQAHFIANRLYNKNKYKNLSIEFEATQESNICILNDRILVSDGTRSGSFEGEVLEQNVLELTLSQNLNLLDGTNYTIFFQYKDGSVESMPITKTSAKNKILLSSAPLMSLAIDPDLYSRTTFIITANTDTRKTAFLLTEKSPKGVMTSELKAINYDTRYYQNDKDLINNIISE